MKTLHFYETIRRNKQNERKKEGMKEGKKE
jgi:hypothetical protein